MPHKQYELSPEAKERKYDYIKKYNKQHYKVYTFKLRTEEDAKIIAAMVNSGKSICSIAKEALEEYFGIK